MVTKERKKGKIFWKMKIGHFFCPFLKIPKKSWIKKSVFYIINGLTYLKNVGIKGAVYMCDDFEQSVLLFVTIYGNKKK
jgi:hypothetical protein